MQALVLLLVGEVRGCPVVGDVSVTVLGGGVHGGRGGAVDVQDCRGEGEGLLVSRLCTEGVQGLEVEEELDGWSKEPSNRGVCRAAGETVCGAIEVGGETVCGAIGVGGGGNNGEDSVSGESILGDTGVVDVVKGGEVEDVLTGGFKRGVIAGALPVLVGNNSV